MFVCVCDCVCVIYMQISGKLSNSHSHLLQSCACPHFPNIHKSSLKPDNSARKLP